MTATRLGSKGSTKVGYSLNKKPMPDPIKIHREPLTVHEEDRLERAEKRLHKSCGNIERILVRAVVFAFFLYGLWRMTEAIFRSHP